MKKLLVNLIYPLAVILLILLIWYIACWWIGVDLILPTPSQAFLNLGELLKDSSFWISLGWTYLRCIEGFLIAFSIALVCSVMAYAYKEIEKFLNPFMAIVRAVPTMAILLILIIMISPSQTPIVIAGIVICPTLYQAFLSGFHQIDHKLIEMANVYHVSKKNQILKLYIPCMKPVILENAATAFSLNIKLVIAAEALAQTRNSIGKLMQFAKVNIEVEKLFALTIVAIILSILSEAILHLLKKVICHD
ncbi:MAG: ABC transporter permease subunit [Anaeroplasmataceae bacterium]|nr:ABC transporter permease subunit [Anaeroplasmataceae bacterium]MDE6414292.1 ABC transporter permease subunit [Anaeroplasmataceae bacterium]